MTAKLLCEELASKYDVGGDGRSRALAATMRELGDVLGDQHTADALRTFWALGLEAEPAKAPLSVSLGRKATLGELLSLCGGVPREIGADELEAAAALGWALVAHYTDRAEELTARNDAGAARAAAMAATFQRELAAVHRLSVPA